MERDFLDNKSSEKKNTVTAQKQLADQPSTPLQPNISVVSDPENATSPIKNHRQPLAMAVRPLNFLAYCLVALRDYEI